ncbi:MAG TPA: 2-C-methyl-D-erythritol 2,4-cyclodiphosphate synthase [Desulfobacteraceae bacterium]|nr:2-C-methyl-D-erythritol 2,4-cyclodiphosphate synthase [Desulfobacteraceae bacterium]
MRTGIGYDIHKLICGRELVLGGVTIPYEKGLLGHSDADVLIHAVCDALLGASGLGDIGLHFPDTDDKFKDMQGIKLLSDTYKLIGDKGFSIINIDSTIFAENPKLSSYKKEMEDNMARVLGIDPDLVNVKATTMEGLGPIGNGDGIGAMAVVLIN